MFWCVLQMGYGRLYCFSSVSASVLICLQRVGGQNYRQRKKEQESERQNKTQDQQMEEQTKDKLRTALLSPSAMASSADQTLVSRIYLWFSDSLHNEQMRLQHKVAGSLCGSFLTASDCFAFQPLPCPLLLSAAELLPPACLGLEALYLSWMRSMS